MKEGDGEWWKFTRGKGQFQLGFWDISGLDPCRLCILCQAVLPNLALSHFICNACQVVNSPLHAVSCMRTRDWVCMVTVVSPGRKRESHLAWVSLKVDPGAKECKEFVWEVIQEQAEGKGKAVREGKAVFKGK